MHLDEALIIAGFTVAMCLSMVLGARLYSGSFFIHERLYERKVALLVNATASSLRNSTSYTLYFPKPVSIVDGWIGSYRVNATGSASGSCIVVEKINGIVRVRSCEL